MVKKRNRSSNFWCLSPEGLTKSLKFQSTRLPVRTRLGTEGGSPGWRADTRSLHARSTAPTRRGGDRSQGPHHAGVSTREHHCGTSGKREVLRPVQWWPAPQSVWSPGEKLETRACPSGQPFPAAWSAAAFAEPEVRPGAGSDVACGRRRCAAHAGSSPLSSWGLVSETAQWALRLSPGASRLVLRASWKPWSDSGSWGGGHRSGRRVRAFGRAGRRHTWMAPCRRQGDFQTGHVWASQMGRGWVTAARRDSTAGCGAGRALWGQELRAWALLCDARLPSSPSGAGAVLSGPTVTSREVRETRGLSYVRTSETLVFRFQRSAFGRMRTESPFADRGYGGVPPVSRGPGGETSFQEPFNTVLP